MRSRVAKTKKGHFTIPLEPVVYLLKGEKSILIGRFAAYSYAEEIAALLNKNVRKGASFVAVKMARGK